MSIKPSETLPTWYTSSEYKSSAPEVTFTKFSEITDLLLERPNLNSSHLFRADILFDSSAKLQTLVQRQRRQAAKFGACDEGECGRDSPQSPHRAQSNNEKTSSSIHDEHIDLEEFKSVEAPVVSGFSLSRRIVRRLIPRKPQVDQPLEQSCFVYIDDTDGTEVELALVIYMPHVKSQNEVPWYHPRVKALAYHFIRHESEGTISVHFQLFSTPEVSTTDRLHRTMLSLARTFVRLAKIEVPSTEEDNDAQKLPSTRPVNPALLKDTILAQHTVQDTYARLKRTYAVSLIARWVEKTEPAKHVFEDLAIAAFLIELWQLMYRGEEFPGFADIACGNGVLVYILIKEGFRGFGFDAQPRKTWTVLGIDDCLSEMLCIPQPFVDVLGKQKISDSLGAVAIHNGVFPKGTFIISNHADELTPWTPIVAALSHPKFPLPFLAIPCCSHALDGSKHRYSLKEVDVGVLQGHDSEVVGEEQQQQPATGDLKALHIRKAQAASQGDETSTYACLTKKTVALAEELTIETEMTLMRIPSTRNIGIVGNRRRRSTTHPETVADQVTRMVERECSMTGGVEASAQTWIDRASKLLRGRSRGKVNLKGNIPSPIDGSSGLA